MTSVLYSTRRAALTVDFDFTICFIRLILYDVVASERHRLPAYFAFNRLSYCEAFKSSSDRINCSTQTSTDYDILSYLTLQGGSYS